MISAIVGGVFLGVSLVILANIIVALNPSLARFFGGDQGDIDEINDNMQLMPKSAISITMGIMFFFLFMSSSISYIAFMDAFK